MVEWTKRVQKSLEDVEEAWCTEVPSTPQKDITCMNSDKLWLYVHDLLKIKPVTISAWKGITHESLQGCSPWLPMFQDGPIPMYTWAASIGLSGLYMKFQNGRRHDGMTVYAGVQTIK